MIELKRILVPTDFSKFSSNALTYACEFADRFGAELHLLAVVDTGTPLMLDPEFMPVDDFVSQQIKGAQEQIEQQPDSSWCEKVTVRRDVRKGIPFLEIIRYAKEINIDLIVMGTHGRSGLTHVLLGSVAEKIVRKAPCPVLTVRYPEHGFVMP